MIAAVFIAQSLLILLVAGHVWQMRRIRRALESSDRGTTTPSTSDTSAGPASDHLRTQPMTPVVFATTPELIAELMGRGHRCFIVVGAGPLTFYRGAIGVDDGVRATVAQLFNETMEIQ